MPYIYAADVMCDSCGEKLKEELLSVSSPEDRERFEDERLYDSDEFPKWMSDDEESDTPQHCQCHEECLEAEVLPSGAKIGALLSTNLTTDGAEYVKQAVADGGEVADFWRSAFDWIDFPSNDEDAGDWRKSLAAGDEVFWIDPDEGACSRTLTVRSIRWEGDDVFVIEDVDGSVVQGFIGELN